MLKKIICVYQDCVMCGDRGKKIKKIIKNTGVEVEKVSFASDKGKELISEAMFKHKIGTMPFYTDGERFSNDLNDLVGRKREKKGAKTLRKRENKEVKNELA